MPSLKTSLVLALSALALTAAPAVAAPPPTLDSMLLVSSDMSLGQCPTTDPTTLTYSGTANAVGVYISNFPGATVSGTADLGADTGGLLRDLNAYDDAWDFTDLITGAVVHVEVSAKLPPSPPSAAICTPDQTTLLFDATYVATIVTPDGTFLDHGKTTANAQSAQGGTGSIFETLT